MLGLMKDARMVLTDSGGIQEETTALGIPCVTMRESTERPVTVTEGTNTIVGSDPDKIRACFRDVMTNGGKQGKFPVCGMARRPSALLNISASGPTVRISDTGSQCHDRGRGGLFSGLCF